MSIWTRLSNIVGLLQQGSSHVLELLQSMIRAAEEERRSLAFTVAMIALSAKMAKADGVVTTDEVLAFRDLFDIPEKEERNVARLFNLAQQDVAGFEAYATKLFELFSEDEATRIDILDGLFHIAKADGILHRCEDAYLARIAEIFQIDPVAYSRIKARHIRSSGSDPYLILGISADASDDEIRRHYRQEVRQTHPDQLIGRGVPEEFVKIASDRLASLNTAYEQICAERGL
ncbi:DnaJ family molecular chaperone [Flexibacterium corallicola]|uniref:DnaJ family molecular chaperone n=1 Tax=Flexibacterium corallicola TaxID=3037259 RepID=UPI00286F0A6C|nr:DnaJ family molecular chaperone [Pseudovibrio sp. M1P-2-3]